jgi:hypothetical protein
MGGTIGTDTVLDRLLAEYYPSTPNSILYELFENETAMLLGALLMEQRGATGDNQTGASYYSTETPLAVDSVKEEKESWDFPAQAVTVHGFDEPINLAFSEPGTSDRVIPLKPSQSPFKLSPPNGVGAEAVWYSKQDTSDADTQISVLAF